MKTIDSTCTRNFVANCIAKSKRLDGRGNLDCRNLEIAFGQERGCCIVFQGNTRVLAQVTCEVTEPTITRPNEGSLHVNLELSQMADPELKQSRTNDEASEAQIILERCVRDSKCIDLESLCIVAGSKVWTIRVNLHTLNNDGNLTECASIAAISALAHFRRPKVTAIGTDVQVHSLDEHEPVALTLHHMPINVNITLFDAGKYIVLDPLEIEERVADGRYIASVNSHQEICGIHTHGNLALSLDVVQRCWDAAIKRAQTVTQVVKSALEDDAYKRTANQPIGFISLLKSDKVFAARPIMPEIDLNEISKRTKEVLDIPDEEMTPIINESAIASTSGEIQGTPIFEMQNMHEINMFEGGQSKWEIDDLSDESVETENKQNDDLIDTEVDYKDEPMEDEMNKILDIDISNSADKETKSNITINDIKEPESNGEEIAFVEPEQIDTKRLSRKWYAKVPFS